MSHPPHPRQQKHQEGRQPTMIAATDPGLHPSGQGAAQAEHNFFGRCFLFVEVGYKFRGSIFKSEEKTTQAVFIG